MDRSNRRDKVETFRVESVRIEARYENAFDYIANPENLPNWTHAFKSVQKEKAIMATPAGTVEIELKVNSSPAQGTIDWRMKFPGGTEGIAYSRLVRQSNGQCIYSFVLLAPPVPLEQLEGALNQQHAILKEELVKLSRLLSN